MEQVQYLIPAALIIDPDKKILFVKKSTARTQICIDKWEIPGGTINFGENFLDGQQVEMQFHVVGALCHISGNDQITPQQERIKEYQWFSVEEFSKLPEDQRVPGDLEIIKTANLDLS